MCLLFRINEREGSKFYAKLAHATLYFIFRNLRHCSAANCVYFLKAVRIFDNYRHKKYIASHCTLVNKYKKIYISLYIKFLSIIREIIYFE